MKKIDVNEIDNSLQEIENKLTTTNMEKLSHYVTISKNRG